MMKKLTIFLFFCITLSGIIFQATKYKLPLYGVTESVPEAEIDGIWDGSWQNNLAEKMNSELLFRAPAIRVRNQIMYSVFRTSPVEYIVRGKDDQLFEESYITNQLQIQPTASDENVDALIEQLEYIQNVLNKRGKKTVCFYNSQQSRYLRRICSGFVPFSRT